MSSVLTVVIAEDDLVFAMILKTFIENRGLNLIGEFRKEDDVVEYCKEHRPDFIILDVHLKEGNGLKARSRIKTFSEAPVLMLSGSTPNAIPDLEGMNYLVKPFMVDDFNIKLNEMLSQYQQHATS